MKSSINTRSLIIVFLCLTGFFSCQQKEVFTVQKTADHHLVYAIDAASLNDLFFPGQSESLTLVLSNNGSEVLIEKAIFQDGQLTDREKISTAMGAYTLLNEKGEVLENTEIDLSQAAFQYWNAEHLYTTVQLKSIKAAVQSSEQLYIYGSQATFSDLPGERFFTFNIKGDWLHADGAQARDGGGGAGGGGGEVLPCPPYCGDDG